MKKKFFYVGPRGGMPYITYAAYDFFFDFLLKNWPYHHREMKKI
jgi:hypothetical protein